MWEAVAAVIVASSQMGGSRMRMSHAPSSIRMQFIEPSVMDEAWFHPTACAMLLILTAVEIAMVML